MFLLVWSPPSQILRKATKKNQFENSLRFCNRPVIAGAVLQTPLSLINSVSLSAFYSQYSRYHKSQTIIDRELKFLEKFTPATCHMSRVMCHMSRVTCHMSDVPFFLVKLIGGGCLINGAYPV